MLGGRLGHQGLEGLCEAADVRSEFRVNELLLVLCVSNITNMFCEAALNRLY